MTVLLIGIPTIIFISIIITKFKFNLKESDDALQENYVNRVKDLYRQSTR